MKRVLKFVLIPAVILLPLIYVGYGLPPFLPEPLGKAISEFTGFGESTALKSEYTNLDDSTLLKTKTTEDIRRAKTFWDWMQLLIIPAGLAVVAYFFNRAENRKEQAVADQRAQDTSLEGYLNQMGRLVLENGLHGSQNNTKASELARARTLTILKGLDPKRKRSVLQFLYESGLIWWSKGEKEDEKEDELVVDLKDADLSGIDASRAVLRRSDLRHVNFEAAILDGADLSDTNLSHATLYSTNLSRSTPNNRVPKDTQLSNALLYGADLRKAVLDYAYLQHANLKQAKLQGASLRHADLKHAELPKAKLEGADLEGADLRHVDLSQVEGLSFEQLKKAKGDLDTTKVSRQLGTKLSKNPPKSWTAWTISRPASTGDTKKRVGGI